MAGATEDGAWALEADGLTKRYGGRAVVDGLDLRCPRGSVLGLLGPNGAGKTTAIRMLYGLIEPDAGTIRFGGRDFAAHREPIRRTIGVTTQDDTLDYDFTVRKNLLTYARYFRPLTGDVAGRVEALIDRFGLREHADKTPHALSGGYRRRLMIARSVVHRPDVLFLDEPTTGLDPKARVDVWELVAAMRREGMTIVLTTHYMDEAERLSDRLLVMSRGRAVAEGSTTAVVGELVGDRVLVVAADEPLRPDVEVWARRLGREPRVVLGELRVPIRAAQLADFTARFGACAFTVRAPNLDDLFLQLSVDDDEGAERDAAPAPPAAGSAR